MKKENKKKVVTLSAMAALLAVVLGMGGKTYAKYFSTADADAQSATVAKWGLLLNQTSSDDDLFKANYSDKVVSLNGTDVIVAPGTSGTITYAVGGEAEVDASIEISFKSYTPVSIKDAGDNVVYNPIIWKVDGTTINPDTWSYTDTYEADSTPDATVTLTWEWPFSTSTDNDTYDTYLGSKANDNSFSVTGLTINTALSFQISAEFKQIQ